MRTNTLYLLFSVSVFFALDVYSSSASRTIVEKKFNSFFPEGVTINIGRLEGGISKDIVASDLRISHANLEKPIQLERVEFPYRFWYPLLKNIKGLSPIKRKGKMKIFFEKTNPFINGFISLDGSFDNLLVLAYVSLLGDKINHALNGNIVRIRDSLYLLDMKLDEDINMRGLTDFKAKNASFEITKNKQQVLLKISKKGGSQIIVNAGLKHLDLEGVDVVGEVRCVIGMKEDAVPFVMTFKNMIVNYSPFKDIEIKGKFLRKRNLIDVKSIRVGDKENERIIEGYAKIGLYHNPYLSMHLLVKGLLLEEFILTKYDEKIASGLMKGEVIIKGPLKELKSRAHIDVRDGRIMDLEFQSLIATLKGNGKLVVLDGCIVKEGGRLLLGGEIDFGLFSSGKAFDKMKMESSQNMAVWEGWEISKRFETSKIQAKKKVAKDITFSFDAYSGENLFDSYSADDKESEIGVEYKLQENESFKMKFKDRESFVGLEHKVRF